MVSVSPSLSINYYKFKSLSSRYYSLPTMNKTILNINALNNHEEKKEVADQEEMTMMGKVLLLFVRQKALTAKKYYMCMQL